MTTLPETSAKKLGLVIDLDTCVGCHACVVSCKGWNTENYGAPLSDQDPYGADPSTKSKLKDQGHTIGYFKVKVID